MAYFSLQTPVVDKGVHLKNGATSAGFIKFFENSGNGTNSVTLIGPASTGDVTITLPASADTLVGKATTDTLTNKTLSGAALSGTFSGTPTFSGVGTHSALDIFNAGISVKNGSTSAGFIELFEDSDAGSSKTTVIGSALSGDITLTLPASTDTLVGKATTDILTNKTLSGAALSGTFSGTPTFSGASTFNAGIIVKNGDANDGGFIQFFEDSDNGSNSVKLALPMNTNLSGDITVRLPTSTGLLLTSGANEYTDTQTFSSKIILTPQIETISDTTATGVSLTITKTVVLLTVTDNDGTEDITISVAAGTSGQLVHIFFTGEGGTDESRNVRLNFGSNSLISGSGRNQYLTFTVTGQSASLIYINDTSGNNIDGWRIINTGAAVSSS